MVTLILTHMDLIKNYDTNINESVITNDFIFSSIDFINSMGISSNYNALLKIQIAMQIIHRILRKTPVMTYLEQ